MAALRILLAALLLAACGDIPQPFRHAGPASELARPRLVRSVAVRPLDDGAPALALAQALAKALTERDIPATAGEDAFGSDTLEGEVSPASGGVEVLWRMRNAERVTKAAYRQRLPAGVLAGTVAALAPFAEQAVSALSAFADTETVAPVAPEPRKRASVRLAPMPTLPGDGAAALGQALRNALERRGIMVAGDSAEYVVEAQIGVQPGKNPGEDVLKVAWVVKKQGGGQLGVIDQQGAVPKGRLDQPWGGLARDIAVGGAIGIAQVLEATGRRPAALQD
jgi:hypothetical protein